MPENAYVTRFAFTLPNWTQDEYDVIKAFIIQYGKYGIIGKEHCPTTGTPHLQGFCNMKTGRRYNTLKRMLGDRMHIELAKGKDTDNQKYCQKEGDYWEHGEPAPGSGYRSDLHEVTDMVKKKAPMRDIAEKCSETYVRYWRGIEKLNDILNEPPDRFFKTEVYYYWGAPGVGKSSRALAEATNVGGPIFYKQRDKWWDGYEYQPNVIIDDFYGWIPYDELLKVCDRYPYRVPIKGGFRKFVSLRIWITSNVPIEQLYKHRHFYPEAIRRRCTKIEELLPVNQ
uniref:Replication-associated protein n=1 Tax=Werosea cyclovirus TaxID=2714177 RepID=A0A858FBH8_9CIRC|nr:replication-associated protein [Werosea cyclovirus]